MANKKGNKDGKQFSEEYQPDEKWTESKAIELGEELIAWLKEKYIDGENKGEDKGNLFFEEFLFVEQDYYPELIAYLASKFKSFLKLIGKAKKIQEIKLMKFGVLDNLNASMTKFTLINNHDWKDKSESETTIKRESPLIINIDGKKLDL